VRQDQFRKTKSRREIGRGRPFPRGRPEIVRKRELRQSSISNDEGELPPEDKYKSSGKEQYGKVQKSLKSAQEGIESFKRKGGKNPRKERHRGPVLRA